MHQGIVSDGAFGSENVHAAAGRVVLGPMRRVDLSARGISGVWAYWILACAEQKRGDHNDRRPKRHSAVSVVLVVLLEWAARVLERDGG